MGLIRKSLYLASGGVVAPRSKKERRHRQTIAALQGRSEEEIRRAGRGGRWDFQGFWSGAATDGVPPEGGAPTLGEQFSGQRRPYAPQPEQPVSRGPWIAPCGHPNLFTAKFCSECGASTFARQEDSRFTEADHARARRAGQQAMEKLRKEGEG